MLFKMEFILNSIQPSTPMKTSIEKYCMFVLPIKQSGNLSYLLFPKIKLVQFQDTTEISEKVNTDTFRVYFTLPIKSLIV